MDGDLAALAELLRERFGLESPPGGEAALRHALRDRYAGADPPPVPPDRYLGLLTTPGEAGEAERARLLALVTVGETRFFRDLRQLGGLAALLPGLLGAARERGSPLALWSAGCATGEEPWTLAMLLAEAGAAPGECELLATDVSAAAVLRTAEGVYAPRQVKDVPPALRARWFTPAGGAPDGGAGGGEVRVAPGLRPYLSAARVHNLLSGDWPRPRAGAWDLILCRNVLIHLDARTRQEVPRRAFLALRPGGWFLLGAAESLYGRGSDFALIRVADALLYQRPPA